MTRLVSTVYGIGRIENDDPDVVALIDVADVDLSRAFDAGRSVAELAASPVRDSVTLSSTKLLAPVPRPSKIWAIGFGYRAHRVEVGFDDDITDPMIFMKASSSVIATGAEIQLPAVAPNEVDYEGELAVVIGRRLTSVDISTAAEGIAGFTVSNDVSARDVQKGRVPGRQADVAAAKSFDTFTPMGPYLVTLDELTDPDDLRLRTWVNGELRQDARTSELIRLVPDVVSYLSKQTTLLPGDVVLTGTPAGVGHRQGLFLRSGDTVEIEIEDVGTLINTCR